MIRWRRKRTLIRPALQLQTAAIFVLVLGASLAVFSAGVQSALARTFDDPLLVEKLSALVRSKLVVALCLGGALTLAAALVVTFRVAGPIFRIERFLRDVRDGRATGPCRLRRGDAFHELCELVNEVTAPLRAEPPSGGRTPSEAPTEQAESDEIAHVPLTAAGASA